MSDEEVEQGVIKFTSSEKGFGFVIPDRGDADVFFHVSGVHGEFAELEKGDRVEYVQTVNQRTGQPLAYKVRRID